MAVVDGPAAIDPRGTSHLTADARRSLGSLSSLLASTPTAPLTVAVRPTLLTALTRSSDATDRRTLQSLQDVSKSPGRTFVVARMPYVALDTGGIAAAAGGNAEALRQVALGDEAVRAVFGTEPVSASWVGDPTVTTSSLGLLQGLGVHRLVISADRLRSTQRGGADEVTSTHTSRLNPSGPTAIAPDSGVAHLLTDDGVAAGVRANRASTALMATWFDTIGDSDTALAPSEVVVIPVDTAPEVLRAFLPTFSSPGPMTADPAIVPAAAEAGGRPLTVDLLPRTSPDQEPAVREVVATRQLIEGFRSLAPGAATAITEWELLNAQTLDRSMSASARDGYHRRVGASITHLTGRIGMPQERRVVLTSRNSTIPLRFRNGLPYDVTLRVRARSGRLDIRGGSERTVVLHPGGNVIDIPVTTRAPGATLLRIDTTSPDGTLVLPSVAIPVTSSTISGVGAALSALSLLVLGGWWLASVRRDRRERRRERAARRRQVLEEARDHAEDEDTEAATTSLSPDGAGSVTPGG
ncbi:MAG: hypothetical protein JST64_11805 [Actinobacteria bacterium]|nr:hypothetical protein [Actinomycetota bacterium]